MNIKQLDLFKEENNLISNSLCFFDPITSYLPDDFVNEDGSIKGDKKINVFMVGFDDINEELYRKLLINNQFVTPKGKSYKSLLVNYYIFDLEKRRSNSYLVNGIKELNSNLRDNKKEYFGLPEKMSKTKFVIEYLEGNSFIDKLNKISEDKDSINFAFVSYGSDYCNAELADKIQRRVKNIKHIYVNAHLNRYLEGVTYYEDYLNKQVDLENILVSVNNAYQNNQTSLDDISKLPEIKIYSNYFQAMNLKHKYHLLGYDFVSRKKESDRVISEKEFLSRFNEINSYKDYFKVSTLVAMIYEEHLHWNAEYMCYGYVPMTIKEHRFEGGKIIEQDIKNHKHGCIASYRGLDKRTRYLHELRVKALNDKTPIFSKDGSSLEVYKYDFQFLKKSYKFLTELGFAVVEKR